MTAELHWFPFFAKDWLSSPARMAMSPEQRGAYIDLLAIAWGNGEFEPGLPDDDPSLARLSSLGTKWKRLGGIIRAQFVFRDGMLRNERLSVVWYEQQRKHGKAVERGRIGRAARDAKLAEKHKNDSSQTSSLAKADLVDAAYQSESESETTRKPVAPDVAKSAGWPARIAAVWSAAVGPIAPGRIGKALKPLVDKHGEVRVERAMKAYIAVRKGENKSPKPEWFVADGETWIERTAEAPGPANGGEMNAALLLMTEPAA